MQTKEERRLSEDANKTKHWRRWGPYLSERQWGTVREDYSIDGRAWSYFPFDDAVSKAYRWGEDGIAGISDNHQRLCFAFSFWNGKDPILKERLFGLGGGEGNHGEDVKEYYFYLDNTPTHSYMKYLYKYPQEEFPYQKLREENASRKPTDAEYELYETKIFEKNQYFDLFVEYAKEDSEDVLICLSIINRSDKAKSLHVLPTLWFRNTWSWQDNQKRPSLQAKENVMIASHDTLEKRFLYFETKAPFLFTENETNTNKFSSVSSKGKFTKDAINRFVIHQVQDAVNPKQTGTKAAAYYHLQIPPKQTVKLKFRLTNKEKKDPFHLFDKTVETRRLEADEFYQKHVPASLTKELQMIQRQSFAGLLWNKQFYHYVVQDWLKGDLKNKSSTKREKGRNSLWTHVYNDDILSVPDKWEYPWFAAWDTAFQAVAYAMIDSSFAKKQLMLLTREWYMHPNGHIPSFEWDFNDVNPPIHAWAAWRVYKIDEKYHKKKDTQFLSSIFQKLLINFTWWVNRKDTKGKNVFQGGFLGLDNISAFNRSEELSGSLIQSDATSWMAMYCLDLLNIALELAESDSSYEDMASKFFEHFLYIAEAMNFHKPDTPALWDEEDGFYYDILHKQNGESVSLKVRSLVGLIPLFAVTTIEEDQFRKLEGFNRRFQWFVKNKPDLCDQIASMTERGDQDRHILAILDQKRLKKILGKMLNEKEFLSPFGIRSLSLCHKDRPYQFECDGAIEKVEYEPAESTSGLFGGNSNWRGPIWLPLNFLIIESLQKFHHYYGSSFKIECPTGSGRLMTLWEVSGEINKRLVKIFKKDKEDFRPIFGQTKMFQKDPHFKDYLLFYEYFHGDKGSGLGASHQTGWTALIAKLIQQYGDYFL